MHEIQTNHSFSSLDRCLTSISSGCSPYKFVSALHSIYIDPYLHSWPDVYHACFPKDKASIKYLGELPIVFRPGPAQCRYAVYLIFLFMALSTCLNAADAYFWYASGFGNLIQFSKAHISPVRPSEFIEPGTNSQTLQFYTPIGGSIIASVIQMFFCYRIWIIKKSAVYLSIAIAIVSTI